MSAYRPGQSLHLTDDGRLVTIWSAAHLPGTYWCHLEGPSGEKPRPVVLVRVTQKRTAPKPVVTLVEDQ